MVEVGKIGDKTLVLDGRYISIFRGGKLINRWAYMGYLLPDGKAYIYRRKVHIKELSGNTLTDYQIKIVLGAGDPIFTHARSAGEDIRFCYYPEEEMLSYWIEKYDPDAEEAIIWVKVPEIPANSEIEIFMYYGNPTVASASDGDATFEFFDDFETDLSKWEIVLDGGTIELSTLYAKQGKQSCRIYHAGTTASFDTYIRHDFGKVIDNIRADAYLLHSSPQGVMELGDGDVIIIGDDANHTNWRYRLGGTFYDSGIARDTGKWHEFSLARMGNTVKYWIDGVEVDTLSGNPAPSKLVFGGFWENNIETDLFVDIVRVRKYTEPEPSVSIGAEE
ncbi:MAG: hypothetical protein DRP01_11090 [Archaeoglobales archaeon]|nr:MAG: hypothetical protein DRP01_11090 [Archaeoglobales archaeon]